MFSVRLTALSREAQGREAQGCEASEHPLLAQTATRKLLPDADSPEDEGDDDAERGWCFGKQVWRPSPVQAGASDEVKQDGPGEDEDTRAGRSRRGPHPEDCGCVDVGGAWNSQVV